MTAKIQNYRKALFSKYAGLSLEPKIHETLTSGKLKKYIETQTEKFKPD